MRTVLLAALLLLPAMAWAADGPEHYSLLLTGQQVILVSKAIGELPYKDAAPLMGEIQRQLQAQVDAWNKAHPAAPEAPPEPAK